MRKYFMIIATLFFLQSFSQSEQAQIVRKEIDSLKKVLPGLSKTLKVDCLNTLAFKYFDLELDWKRIVDSSLPYSLLANAEAKRINYQRGLGYSYLRMALLQVIKFRVESNNNNNYDSSLLTASERNAKQAISVGEKISDHIIIGGGYWVLAWLAEERSFVDYENNLKKAILHYEKSGKQPKQGTYQDQNYANCTGCEGNEILLGQVYWEMGRAYIGKNDFKTAKALIKKAISYFEKADDKKSLGSIYYNLSYVDFKMYDYAASEEASLKSISYYQDIRDEKSQMGVYTELCKVFEIPGDFENGLRYSSKSISLAEKLARNKPANSSNKFTWGQAFFWMCRLYKIGGDYETAMEIIRRGYNYYPLPMDEASKETWVSEIGDVHRLMGNYDSAMYYLESFATNQERWDFGKVALGYLYLDLKQYNKALQLVTPVIQKLRKLQPMPPLVNCLIIAANASFAKKDYQTALAYGRESHAYLNLMNGRHLMIKNNKTLSDIFHALGQNDSAYFYYNQFSNLKDSLLNRQFLWKLNSYKKEAEEQRKTSQINLLNKDNQLKEQKLKQQATLRNNLIIGILLLLLLGIFIFRNLFLNRKNDKFRMQKDFELQQLENDMKQAELHQKTVELEMQALRAQMNPHFIFNCLSSINRFIFKNDNKVASDYLTRFSRLIRMVLMHSQKKLIPLEDELEMIRLYLDLERLRFKNAFDYSITTTNIVDAGNIFIPPLLLQPFCENAVWHGLMHKETKGHLNIIISEVINEDNKVLHCVIEDDGVGRENAAQMKSKSAENEKSMGLKITTERLALLNQENNFSTFYKIEDVLNENYEVAGTRVQLKIRYKESIEEYV